MNATDIKHKIKEAIQKFDNGNLSENALNLFQALGYITERRAPLEKPTYAAFKGSFIDNQSRFNEDKALVKDWKYVDLLFQLSKEEVSRQLSLFDTKQVDRTVIETYLFFTIGLAKEHYSRTELSHITREVNHLFPMPVMILFKHGSLLTLSVINRRLHKRDESKDVLEKVTLIKDIKIPLDKRGQGVVTGGEGTVTHRAHIEVLFDLSFDELKNNYGFTNFVELHNAWQKTLDTKELNKRFFQELANWYFWATQKVEFPDDAEKDREIRNATNIIRLITRLMFVWFLKEKGLVPDELFDEKQLKKLLKYTDNKKSTYYKAILQNLFFATLNTEMGNRRFRTKNDSGRDGHYFIHNVFRYEGEFVKPKETLEQYFAPIPFLNGGLFECLDKELDDKGKRKRIRIDDFSDREDNVLKMPDELFFNEKGVDVDLSTIYGSPKKGKEKVRGLIDILNSYKFTVTENTPIEEEIALDPELLGKVFENLLANYNPETQTTARKQTGSFYTPREIVNYMVDESLIAYLSRAAIANRSETEVKQSAQSEKIATDSVNPHNDVEERLRELLSYSENLNSFNAKETAVLIKAIDTCKILDPACGSGAFPMGILHKMVHILHKLDPNNSHWKQRQLDKVDKLIEEAEGISDTRVREKVIEDLHNTRRDIEESFDNNELDYGRKLYLIENCIYGVDIQPIAVQIAKLRFFISLIVDQKVNSNRDNLGVRPLPNLETKFVAANTLIGLEKEQANLFTNPNIEKKKTELKKVRHDYFEARTPKRKESCRNKDKQLRDELAELLIENHGFQPATAKKIAAWDPYDQNTSASFFDNEWMFGVKEGVDVVIGNPPYVQIQNFSGMQQKDWEKQKYETYTKTGDVYCLFYERGYGLLKDGGVLTFITSNKWMRANYGKVMRKFFAGSGTISQLIDFGDSPIFENATTYTNILVWKKDKQKAKTIAWDLSKAYTNDVSLGDLLVQQGECEPLFNESSFVIVKGEQTVIKKRIEEIGVPLKDWNISIYRGILTGLNEAFIIDGKKKEELIAKDPKSAEVIKPILRGRDIKRYKAEFADLWLINTHNGYTDKNKCHIPRVDVKKDYPALWEYLNRINKIMEGQVEKRYDQGDHWSNLRNCAYFNEIEKEKIFYAEIVFDSAFHYDTNLFYPEATTFIITGERLKYLTALLNSKLLTYAFRTFYAGGDLRGNTFRYKKVFIELLPVPKLSPESQLPFEILVDCILFCKEHNLQQESDLFESVIDGMVYELYFLEEIKTVDCKVLKHIAKLPKFKDDWSYEKKLVVIEKIYKELLDPKHPVTIAMEKMQKIPEVKIIEGRDMEKNQSLVHLLF